MFKTDIEHNVLCATVALATLGALILQAVL
jgi:hypothetical protein